VEEYIYGIAGYADFRFKLIDFRDLFKFEIWGTNFRKDSKISE